MENSSVKRSPERGPQDQPFLDLAASLERAGRIEELIKLHETKARDLAPTGEACDLLTRAAELARDRLKNPARAEELFRRALLYAPDAKAPLKGLKALYEHQLQRKDRATLCCQQASKADPTSRQSFRRCRLLFLSDQRYLSAFESLQRERASLGNAAMAEDYASLAEQLAEDPTEHPLALKAVK